MRHPTRALLAAALAAASLATAPRAARAASAEGTIGCHCFRDRSFDPARPAAADPYVLATSRSSLLSAAFGAGKAGLVSAVMRGTAPEDLWVAHWAAARTGGDAGALLSTREAKGSWRAALAGRASLGVAFDAALARGAPATELAALAVDDVLVSRVKAEPAALRAFRAAGASSEETILATLLAARLEAPTLPLLVQVKAGRTTWGAVLRDVGLTPEGIEPFVRTLVR